MSENPKNHPSAPPIKWNDYKWSYVIIKGSAKVWDFFWTTQNHFESSKQKCKKSSFWDVQSGYESGYGFASPFNIIRNDAFDILLFKYHQIL